MLKISKGSFVSAALAATVLLQAGAGFADGGNAATAPVAPAPNAAAIAAAAAMQAAKAAAVSPALPANLSNINSAAISGILARAGTDMGNGGDICEDRIDAIRDDIESWITKGGPAGLSFPSGVSLAQYDSAMLASIAAAQVSCTDSPVIVDGAEKTCENFVNAQGAQINAQGAQILCNRKAFMDETGESDQYVLVHHEYAGLAGFEVNDGEASQYPISNQISGFLVDETVKKLAVMAPSQGMSFVAIQPGTFQMGSPVSEANRNNDETQHEVTITHGFEMETTDVTQAQWIKVMGVNPSSFQSQQYCQKTFANINGVQACPDNPVEQVSWDDAQGFIQKLNSTANDGYTYRLPTEAEWEYAARAGTTTAYYFGNDPSQLGSYGWYDGNPGNQTHEVAQLKPNGWGLYDMEGNVWQWVQDWYGDYSNSQVTDPTGPSSGSLRVIRGGGWDYVARLLRSALRSYGTSGSRADVLGFRLVRTRAQ